MKNNVRQKIDIYTNIDMKRSGQKMKQMITNAGYNVKAIQDYLQLSCPQPVYRWFHGQVLPTVDHLFMLSRLLGVHMEDFLVEKEVEQKQIFDLMDNDGKEQIFVAEIRNFSMYVRMLLYYKHMEPIMNVVRYN